MGYIVMACKVMAYIAMAHRVMVYTVRAHSRFRRGTLQTAAVARGFKPQSLIVHGVAAKIRGAIAWL